MLSQQLRLLLSESLALSLRLTMLLLPRRYLLFEFSLVTQPIGVRDSPLLFRRLLLSLKITGGLI